VNNGRLGICVNPMSGRDVRRLAARASNMTHEAKRDIVARIAAGADAVGVSDIYITREPFRIASLALEHMRLNATVHVLEHKIANNAGDTERAIDVFREAGCQTIVSLGGDGTNRAIVRATSDLDLVPISTGTNNVFPILVEPTTVGMAAGLNALGLITDRSLGKRVKVIHVKRSDGLRDVGLIDAVLIENDHVGNLLPYDPKRLRRILLTRAEATAVGMSPIGGFLEEIDADMDEGMLIELGPGRKLTVPLSPGHFRDIEVASFQRVPFDVTTVFHGPGVLALDGDRDHTLTKNMSASVTIKRDGPWVLDVAQVMQWAVSQGIIGGKI